MGLEIFFIFVAVLLEWHVQLDDRWNIGNVSQSLVTQIPGSCHYFCLPSFYLRYHSLNNFLYVDSVFII